MKLQIFKTKTHNFVLFCTYFDTSSDDLHFAEINSSPYLACSTLPQKFKENLIKLVGMAAFQVYYYLVCLNSDLLKAFMKGLTSFLPLKVSSLQDFPQGILT